MPQRNPFLHGVYESVVEHYLDQGFVSTTADQVTRLRGSKRIEGSTYRLSIYLLAESELTENVYFWIGNDDERSRADEWHHRGAESLREELVRLLGSLAQPAEFVKFMFWQQHQNAYPISRNTRLSTNLEHELAERLHAHVDIRRQSGEERVHANAVIVEALTSHLSQQEYDRKMQEGNVLMGDNSKEGNDD